MAGGRAQARRGVPCARPRSKCQGAWAVEQRGLCAHACCCTLRSRRAHLQPAIRHWWARSLPGLGCTACCAAVVWPSQPGAHSGLHTMQGSECAGRLQRRTMARLCCATCYRWPSRWVRCAQLKHQCSPYCCADLGRGGQPPDAALRRVTTLGRCTPGLSLQPGSRSCSLGRPTSFRCRAPPLRSARSHRLAATFASRA